MSRQAPIYISDSEEEPMEDSYHSLASSGVTTHPRATSDDSGDAYVVPPTMPVVTPATVPVTSYPPTRSQYHAGETSSRPAMRRTARIVIRDFPRGPLAPRDKAPVTEPEEPPQRRHPHLDWMPGMLRYWRTLEDIPSTLEIGEPSRPLSITGEPLELTAVTLVALVRALFGLHYGTRSYIRELRSDTSRLDGDVASIYGRLNTVETHMYADRESVDATRARVTMLERRARVVGLIMGVGLMLAAMVTAIGLYLFYLH